MKSIYTVSGVRTAVAATLLSTLAAGCSYVPEFPIRVNDEATQALFVNDNQSATPQASSSMGGGSTVGDGTADQQKLTGLQIRKSSRGNMESYVVRGQRYFTMGSSQGYSARGLASWYGPNFHGRTASSGEVYDMYRLTAAHKTLPLPTYAKVTHMTSGRSVLVKINDRGPFSGDRIIDLSFAAALRLGMVNDGTAMVEIQALTPEEVMAISGPENKLDVEFYNADEEIQQAAAKPVENSLSTPPELVSVKPVAIDNQPIEALTKTEPAVPMAVDPVALEPMAVEVKVPASVPVAVEPVQVMTVGSKQLQPPIGLQSAPPVVVPARPLPASELQTSENDANKASIELATKLAAEPVTMEAVSTAVNDSMSAADTGIAAVVPAAVQAVQLPNGAKDKGYFIQAGVFARVEDAERVAVDTVLATPEEEVFVKPMKDSTMYRITVGPMTSFEHAKKVSAKLTKAGIDNFTVKVE